LATVVIYHGYRIEVYSNDHFPSHVHITKPGVGTAKVQLLNNGVALHSYHGFSVRQAVSAAKIVDAHLHACWAKWREIHG